MEGNGDVDVQSPRRDDTDPPAVVVGTQLCLVHACQIIHHHCSVAKNCGDDEPQYSTECTRLIVHPLSKDTPEMRTLLKKDTISFPQEHSLACNLTPEIKTPHQYLLPHWGLIYRGLYIVTSLRTRKCSNRLETVCWRTSRLTVTVLDGHRGSAHVEYNQLATGREIHKERLVQFFHQEIVQNGHIDTRPVGVSVEDDVQWTAYVVSTGCEGRGPR